MAGNLKGKRPAPVSSSSSKKRKLNNGKHKSNKALSKGKGQEKEAKKEKAADRGIIPIPNLNNDEDTDISDQDIGLLSEFGEAAGFLKSLDRKGIMRSKKETKRLHELAKPARQPQVYNDDLPSLDSGDEDDWDSNLEELESDMMDSEVDDESLSDELSEMHDDSDAEMAYEAIPRKRRPSWETPEKPEVRRLPIKLADGKIKDTGIKPIRPPSRSSLTDGSEDSDSEEEPQQVEDVSTGARFGRPAVMDVLQTKSRKQKVEMAKEQIAGICQEILADPENSLGLLRRLHSFALPTITTPTHPDPVSNDPLIRQLAILSQLAIFKDIVPGYRIRALTEAEKAEKVSQMVARTRDWEQGLVTIYQSYLRLLESELKARSQLADIALHSICTLLTEATHFNFRVNLMTCIVSRLSKKSWDKSSEMCSKTLITVFREDLTGVPSLEIVRLLNRMIKERHFRVHPNVLSCLLQLRLRTELGVRASDRYADRPDSKKKEKYGKGKKAQPVHLSKKAKKAFKEQKEINKELREAEAEVDKDERKTTQTETLKLLFALYFRILKNPTPTPLLPSALSGISRFAHLVNIDFFKDLMKVLKDLIAIEEQHACSSASSSTTSAFPEDDAVDGRQDPDPAASDVAQFNDSVLNGDSAKRRLMCIVTAFELLSGQGEALNIDLSEFVSSLYTMLMPLTFAHEITAPGPVPLSSASAIAPASAPKGNSKAKRTATTCTPTIGKSDNPSILDLLFHALTLIFSPQTSASARGSTPPWRAAAFAKRLLSSCLHWPSPPAVLRALEFVRTLVAQTPQLEAMLSTEDRIFNGVYRPDVDDPQLCHPFESSFWELHALRDGYWDERVRMEAAKLLSFRSS